MQKPDIAELRRLSPIRPVSIVHELCDYIDSLSELDTERRLAWYRNLRTKIQDCPLEDSPVTGHFWRKCEPIKVAPEDPKHYAVTFVGYGGTGVSVTTAYDSLTGKYGRKTLKVFEIDQETGDLTEVPKKPTAEEIATDELRALVNSKPSVQAEYVVMALREAGLLKEGA